MDFFSVLKLLLGLSFFIFGMSTMSANLERMAGGKLENTLRKMTSNPVRSILLGAGITIAVQSSSATTVMLVGLVNSGLMTVAQTVNVIFGANIGTTLTSWILSLSGIKSDYFLLEMLKPENFSPILALIGTIIIMATKSEKKKSVGTIFVGFAVLMYGMEFMKNSVSPLAETEGFSELLVRFSNPIFGVLIGTAVTAVIQSSAASIGILQALSLTGSVTLGMAIPIVMGQNIGTCATSLISCIGTNTKAKRVAVVHVSIKIIGTIICLPIYLIIDKIAGSVISSVAATPALIALVHTIFNIVITVLLMPVSKLVVRLAKVIVKEKEKKEVKQQPLFRLDERLLATPSVAVGECDRYTIIMSKIAGDMLHSSFTLFDSFDEAVAKSIADGEEKLDSLEDSLGTYLVKLSSQALSDSDSRVVSKMLHVIGNFERLGDHALNLVKVAREINEKGIRFSDDAVKELSVLKNAAEEIIDLAMAAYVKNDVELAAMVEPLEQVIDGLTEEIRANHIERLRSGSCTIELGFVLSDTLTNYERISDHCSNIAVAVVQLINGSFNTHKYLNSVKYGDGEFVEAFNNYEKKYSI